MRYVYTMVDGQGREMEKGVLAQLLRMDYLPESYVPDKEIRNKLIKSECV